MTGTTKGALKRSNTLFLSDAEQFVFDFGGSAGGRAVSPGSSHGSGGQPGEGDGEKGIEETDLANGRTGVVTPFSERERAARVAPLDAEEVQRYFDKALKGGRRILLENVPLDEAIEKFQLGLRRYEEWLCNQANSRNRGDSSKSRGDPSNEGYRGKPGDVARDAKDRKRPRL
ncbi:hypothetical protein, conserved [Trypanosoma brucei gambiense DAL972]|uniref:Uncharacterized protein n=1 Tax=Trypanosoma brucei gambiense (strain MHOM/CI/86/DAL972) TaxID=679716 RepID=C9ZVB0_TRYB9|nr:hypothetical protein, conserved [Trypanosoma brucei gambiense DAL972]CBH13348.1 hypothetical protein, conserved [Trypanosoma brucei gambiense DAL972]|eukprot:XP_011775625.1 hypothetical protein, conserved [Trypanosoma brucei gambiense DAL972]